MKLRFPQSLALIFSTCFSLTMLDWPLPIFILNVCAAIFKNIRNQRLVPFFSHNIFTIHLTQLPMYFNRLLFLSNRNRITYCASYLTGFSIKAHFLKGNSNQCTHNRNVRCILSWRQDPDNIHG